MTVNEPGVVARRQMTISHPLAAEWPQWLRLWWGQIQPPDLLLRIGAFPTLTRLPSPALFPALALEALSRVHSFLGASLPFLDTGATQVPTAAPPRLDVRLRRPRAQAFTQLPDVHGVGEPRDATVQADHLRGIEHPRGESEHEPEDSLGVEEAPRNQEDQREAPPEQALTPFQESQWEPLAPEPEHAPSLGESVQQLEHWRDTWSAAEAVQPIERGIGVLQNTLGRSVAVPLLGFGAPARVMTSVLAEPPAQALLPAVQNLSAELPNLDILPGTAQLREAMTATAAQDVGMPGETVTRVSTALRAPDSATRAAQLVAGETLPSDLTGEARALPNLVETSATHLAADLPQPIERVLAQPFAAFAASEAMPAAQALLTPHFSPLVGEVLHRQERAIESLALIGHPAAAIEAPELPAAALAAEPSREPAQPLSGEHAMPAFNETQLPQQTQAAEMVVHTPHAADTTTTLADGTAPGQPAHETLTHEAPAAPAIAQPAPAADQAVRNRPIMVENATASQGILASQPNLELRRPLTSVAPRMALNALQLPHFPARAEEIGIASLLALPGLLPRHEVESFAAQAGEAREAFVSLTEPFAAAEAERVFMPHAEEPALLATARSFAGFAPGLMAPAHELTRGTHPLALRPLPDISHLLRAEHAAEAGAHGGEQPPNMNLVHELLAAPHMDVRRETPAASGLAQPQNAAQASANWPWASESAAGNAPAPHDAAAAQSAALAAPETSEGGGDAGGVWQGGSAPAVAPSAPPDVEAIARQVLGMLQSQLRAERDRHQIYDR